ncbi:MAG TPA: glycosyltransferase, partial [Candidatus Bathyarchaeia archaeon]|nr:glycosyltransferase [Candidatus Bathyarchaeia archaeon]
MLIGVDANEANQKNRVGVGQFAFNVIRQLEKIDKRNFYLLYLKEPALPDLPKEREGWRYRVFGPSKLWTQVALPLKLFTQREKLSVFYSPSHYAPRLSPFPTVISIMDLWHHRHPEQFAKKDLYQLRKWESYSVKRASRIVTISEFSKSEIVKIYQYPPEKIMVAYPG